MVPTHVSLPHVAKSRTPELRSASIQLSSKNASQIADET